MPDLEFMIQCQFINCDIATICTGMAASMAAVLLCAGKKGKRTALKHSRVMIHQPMGGTQGQVSDIEISTREIIKVRNELIKSLLIIVVMRLKKFNRIPTVIIG